tara:strand:- start:63158 stop:64675 length:1518 start_codon:yes stop_codon:yes gene_type:complete
MNRTRVDKIFKLLRISSICFFIFFSPFIFCQDQPPKTSSKKNSTTLKNVDELLKISKDYISKNEYNKAVLFLSNYYDTYSENLYVNWLYAYALSMNNNNAQAKNKFKKAISIDATNINLQLDYARFLYKIGKINKVESILFRFLSKNSTNSEFLMMLANISFWKGNIQDARKEIARIKTIYPKTEITKNLENQINSLTATYIKTDFEYQTDSQPLDYFANHIIAGEYISRFLSPELEISRYRFSPQKEGALILKLKNQFYFDKLKLAIKVTGGAYLNDSDQSDFIGGIRFSKNLFKNASLDFGYSKEALLGTIASTAINLTYQSAFGELDYNNKWVLFHAWYDLQFFKDDNEITSFGSWVLSQPIKFRKFNFQIGYSYNYTDSKDVLFFFDNQGVGVYDPYFTPKEQEIHSGLFVVNYKPIKKLSFEAKVSYGFIGNIRNPYPLQVTPNSIEIGGFYDATFTPIELTGNIEYQFSDHFSAKITYIDQETFFYTRQNINLGLNFTF